MATLKDVKNKIKSVKKTKQITKAMNMVAASKLRSCQANMEAFRPYARKFAEVLGSLAERAGEGASPLLVARDDVKKIHIVLCTSDRGLCGGFNTNLVEKAEAFMRGENRHRHRIFAHRLRPQGPELVSQEQRRAGGRAHRDHGDRHQVQ